MRVAIVHDWLTNPGGAEVVLESLISLFPDCDIYTIVDFVENEKRNFLHGKTPKTSFIQRLPFAKRRYRNYIFLMPMAIEQFDLSAYDLIISSSFAVAKGVIVSPDQIHVAYIHSPLRYAWDQQHIYLRESKLERGISSILARCMLHYLRLWDCRTSAGPDVLIANSQYIRRRVRRIYGRESAVIYPPVNIQDLPYCEDKEDFYVTASRLVPYKRISLISEAFRELPERRLIIIGDGPEYAQIDKARPKNVTLLGYQTRDVLMSYISKARAFIFAAEEDFGILSVEAQGCGTPVIAYGKGGSTETVRPYPRQDATGILYSQQTIESIVSAVHLFESNIEQFIPTRCVENAARFSQAIFLEHMQRTINKTVQNSQADEDDPGISVGTEGIVRLQTRG